MKGLEYSFQVVWSDEDDAYIATCPELDGVSGHGASPEEAILEAKVALQLTIDTYREEGWVLPEPARMVEYSGQFRARIPKSLHAKLAQQALNEGVSLNTYVVSLLASNSGKSEVISSIKDTIQALSASHPNPHKPVKNANANSKNKSPSSFPFPTNRWGSATNQQVKQWQN